MARSILSLGMFWARAAVTAVLSRAFMAGSGMPILAAAVISRARLEKSLESFLSWAPLRNWMFLHLECPAIEMPGCAWLAALGVRSSLYWRWRPKSKGQRRRGYTRREAILAKP